MQLLSTIIYLFNCYNPVYFFISNPFLDFHRCFLFLESLEVSIYLDSDEFVVALNFVFMFQIIIHDVTIYSSHFFFRIETSYIHPLVNALICLPYLISSFFNCVNCSSWYASDLLVKSDFLE